MSAFGMNPTFNTKEGYLEWRQTWKALYKRLSRQIQRDRAKTRLAQSTNDPSASEMQSDLHATRAMASKAMTLLQSAKERWARIKNMQKEIDEQMASFPLVFDKVQNIDFFFNKASLDYSMLPYWVLKFKGKSFYMHHVDFHGVDFSTRELDSGSTRGMLRFRHCSVELMPDGRAVIRNARMPTALAA